MAKSLMSSLKKDSPAKTEIESLLKLNKSICPQLAPGFDSLFNLRKDKFPEKVPPLGSIHWGMAYSQTNKTSLAHVSNLRWAKHFLPLRQTLWGDKLFLSAEDWIEARDWKTGKVLWTYKAKRSDMHGTRRAIGFGKTSSATTSVFSDNVAVSFIKTKGYDAWLNESRLKGQVNPGKAEAWFWKKGKNFCFLD